MNAMDCTDIKANLSALIDGVLDREQRYLAERHLADCAACRRMIDEAEMIDALVAADVASREAATDPIGALQSAVLARTIGGGAGGHWTAWLGWVAAAASLMLAVTLWIVSGQGAAMQATRSSAQGPDAFSARAELSGDGTAPMLGVPADAQPSVTSLGPTVSLVRSTPRDLEAAPAPAPPADPLTIDTTVFLLGMLAHADLDSFQDVERIRAAVVYEELPQKLATELDQAPPGRWEAIRAAKWFVDRIAAGPISMGDIRQMQQDLSDQRVLERLEDVLETGKSRISL